VDAPQHWGTSSLERARRPPADDLVATPAARWTRGVTSRAAPAHLWRWVTQLSVAPYSYDLVDNLDWSSSAALRLPALRLPRVRPSPRELTPGADDLRVGQHLLVLFVVDSFADGEHLTLRLRRPGRGVVGEFAITYAVRPDGLGRTRLVATVVVDGPCGTVGTLARLALAWGDLVMMRRQLTRLATLADRSPDWVS
jgi:hypothetical protein